MNRVTQGGINDGLVQRLDAVREASKVAKTLKVPSAEELFQATRNPLVESFVYQKIEMVKDQLNLLEMPDMTLTNLKDHLERDLQGLEKFNRLKMNIKQFSTQKRTVEEKENQLSPSYLEQFDITPLVEGLRVCEIEVLGANSLQFIAEIAFQFSRRLFSLGDGILEAVEDSNFAAEATRKELKKHREEELKFLDKECNRLKRELITATATMETSSSEVRRLTSKNKDFDEELRKLRLQAQTKEKEVIATQGDLTKLKNILDRLNNECSDKDFEIDKHKSSLAVKNKEESQLNSDLTERNQHLEQEKKNLVRAQEELRKTLSKLKMEEGRLKETRDEFQRLSLEIVAAQDRYQSLKITSQQLSQKLKSEEEDKKTLSQKLETLNSEVSSLKSDCSDQERTRSDLIRMRKSSADEIERLTKMLDEALIKEGRLKRTQSVREANGSLNRILEDYEKENALLNFKCEDARKENESLDTALNSFLKHIDKGKEWRDSAEVRRRESIFLSQKFELERLEKLIEKHKSEIEKQERERGELAKINQESQIELEEQQQLNTGLVYGLSQLRNQTIQIYQENEKAAEDLTSSIKKAQELNSKILLTDQVQTFMSSLAQWEPLFFERNLEVQAVMKNLVKEMNQQFQQLTETSETNSEVIAMNKDSIETVPKW